MRLAMVGTGGIVHEALDALKPVENIECTAIYGRPHSRDKAVALAADYHIPQVCTDYDQLLRMPDTEFVYIGLVNSAHYEYARAALLAGRHVILEKPFASTAAEANELVRLAVQRGCYLFEAVTLFSLPNFQAIQEVLPRLGRLRMVQCNYSQYSSRYGRYCQGEVLPVFDPQFSGGALYDINIYNLNFVVGLFGMPKDVHYTANLGFNGIDTSGVLVLEYEDFTAVCNGAKDSDSPGYLILQGEKGYIHAQGAPNALSSFDLVLDGRKQHQELNVHAHRMTDEFIEFADVYGRRDWQRMLDGLQRSLQVMQIAERARQQAGIRFAADR